jgi:hypothetical protein
MPNAAAVASRRAYLMTILAQEDRVFVASMFHRALPRTALSRTSLADGHFRETGDFSPEIFLPRSGRERSGSATPSGGHRHSSQ